MGLLALCVFIFKHIFYLYQLFTYFIFTEVTSAIQGEKHDMRKDPDAEIQNSLCIQQLISELQTLENNSHHMVWFLCFCKRLHLQLRKAHSIPLVDPWENGQALMFMQVRIKALRRETKGYTIYTLCCFQHWFSVQSHLVFSSQHPSGFKCI